MGSCNWAPVSYTEFLVSNFHPGTVAKEQTNEWKRLCLSLSRSLSLLPSFTVSLLFFLPSSTTPQIKK